MHDVERRRSAPAAGTGGPFAHEADPVERRGAGAGAERVQVHVRRERLDQVRVLHGDVQLVPARGQLADESERHEPIAVGPVVRQQRGRVGDEDAQRHAPMMVHRQAVLSEAKSPSCPLLWPNGVPGIPIGLRHRAGGPGAALAAVGPAAQGPDRPRRADPGGGSRGCLRLHGNRDYESTSKLLFRQTIGAELNAVGVLPNTPDADNLSNSNVDVVGSRAVAAATADSLRRRGWTARRSRSTTTSRCPRKDSDVVDIVASASSAEGARQLAYTYAREAVDLAGRAAAGARRARPQRRGAAARLADAGAGGTRRSCAGTSHGCACSPRAAWAARS